MLALVACQTQETATREVTPSPSSLQPTTTSPMETPTSATTPTATTTPVSLSSGAPECVSAYVLAGGDITPSGLTDAPRTFEYEIQVIEGNTQAQRLSYTALPPSPAGSDSTIELNFHAGQIHLYDYLEACGDYDDTSNTIVVYEEGHFITTMPTTKAFVVRHAERASSAPNTNLANPTGLNRATALANLISDANVTAIYSTRYCRTVQTAQPAALQLDLPINVQTTSDPNAILDSCNPPITAPTDELPASLSSLSAFAQFIKGAHSDHTILIVGHSNSVPPMLNLLSGVSVCPEYLSFDNNGQCVIPEDEFNHFFTVLFSPDADQGLILHRTYEP